MNHSKVDRLILAVYSECASCSILLMQTAAVAGRQPNFSSALKSFPKQTEQALIFKTPALFPYSGPEPMTGQTQGSPKIVVYNHTKANITSGRILSWALKPIGSEVGSHSWKVLQKLLRNFHGEIITCNCALVNLCFVGLVDDLDFLPEGILQLQQLKIPGNTTIW